MIKNNNFNNFVPQLFLLDTFQTLFQLFFFQFGQNTGFVKYPKEKIEEHLPFPLINWPFLQKTLHGNLGETPGDRCVLILKELVGTIRPQQRLFPGIVKLCEVLLTALVPRLLSSAPLSQTASKSCPPDLRGPGTANTARTPLHRNENKKYSELVSEAILNPIIKVKFRISLPSCCWAELGYVELELFK